MAGEKEALKELEKAVAEKAKKDTKKRRNYFVVDEDDVVFGDD